MFRDRVEHCLARGVGLDIDSAPAGAASEAILPARFGCGSHGNACRMWASVLDEELTDVPVPVAHG